MEKFVSSLKRCKNDAVLFHPLRKIKYNQLKTKLKSVLNENVIFGQDETTDKKKKKSYSNLQLEKIKKSNLQELVTVVEKTPKKSGNKVSKSKKKNKNLKIIDQPEAVIKKQKEKLKNKVKSSGTNVKKKENARNVSDTNNANILEVHALQKIFQDNECFTLLDTTADSSVLDEYLENEQSSFVNMYSTSSPVVVRNKRKPAVTHCMLQDFKKKQKKKVKTSGSNVKKKENARNVSDTNNANILKGNNNLQEMFLDSGSFSLQDTTADGSVSDEHSENEEIYFVNMDTTSSPIVVDSKSRPAVTHRMLQEFGRSSNINQNDSDEEFSSVLSCFRKFKNSSNVVLETCELSPSCTIQVNSAPDEQSPVTKVKQPMVVPDKNPLLRLHRLPNRSCAMTMKHPCDVYVRGQVKVTVLKGAVEILGFKATPENSESGLNVFSPQRCMCVSIVSCKPQEGAQDNSYIKKLEALKASYSKLLKECVASDCVLLLQETSSVLTKYLNRHFPIDLFPKVFSGNDRKFYKEENLLQCQFELPGTGVNVSHLTRKDEWEQVISDSLLFAGGSKTVVLGGKGVGKSTFLRFLANSWLSKNDAVLWLDFDPGQAEFTVPGCLSAILVKKPLLGPNFTHQTTPIRMVFLGDIDVSRCPSRYNSCVEHIVQYCLSQPDLQNIPWLINTMGYSKGLGVELAISMIRVLRPTTVIHIESQRRAQNFAQPLRSGFVNNHVSIWKSGFTACDLDYATFILPSAVKDNSNSSPGLKPRDGRELAVLAYLSQVARPPRYSLLDAVPCSTPLARLTLGICHEAVPQSRVLGAVNGGLVALCACDTRPVWTSGDPDMAGVLLEAPVVPCLGFGIVRGIDMVNKMLYLTTPLPVNDMSRVNCLLMGAVSLPPCVSLAVESGSGQVPYVAKGGEQPMGRAMRRAFRPHLTTDPSTAP
ncbi:polynucleotide 5'-hydroxyl-kinase NOL9 [Bacillus rossius redtenbacheri]|uniref:polynucleotide 5'-hydroxyl-kinase NOL9 n=1 Tax=Bacillus rossius redtenbacheri TaxID=93214 RepID=UPI002FDE0940